MIAGLEEISGGELYIDDKLVNDVDAKDRDIAMVNVLIYRSCHYISSCRAQLLN